jgi:hypothetical protein
VLPLGPSCCSNASLACALPDALIERGVRFLFTTGHDASAINEAYRDYPAQPNCPSSRVVSLPAPSPCVNVKTSEARLLAFIGDIQNVATCLAVHGV